jgi:Fe-S cluster assembly ATP-binding protein
MEGRTMTLKLHNIHVEVDGKEVVKDVSLTFTPGTVSVVMGPNGAGKSSVLKAVMGHPKYTITKGTITLDGEDITTLSVDEKAKKGLFLSFQDPVEIPGVRMSHFLRTVYNAQHETQLGVMEFKKLVDEKKNLLGLSDDFLKRSLNEGFSGGEKKKAEILQLLVLEPRYALLDETDSGLDVDAIKKVAEHIETLRTNENKMGIVIVTHYKRFLEYLHPDHVCVIDNGQVVMEGDATLAEKVEQEGFGGVQ